jgi:serine/threonine-protein kinase
VSDVVCPHCEHACEPSQKFCPVCGFPVAELTSQSQDPLIGTTLPGGYVIQELVGVGGMGRVYRAEQKALGRTVAVKIIHPHLLGDESASARFITEARAASRLNHPNSVGVIDFGRNGGQLYLVMEFLRGRDLARVVYEDGLLPIPRTADIMVQVLAALAEAHHLDIIHRDLKPENIVLEQMRSGGDFVKVVDFGLAKIRDTGTNITSPGLVCGTPDYMAPEQGRGDPIDARSDLYACGVILFQLLTGRLPFEAESPTQVVLMHLSQPPPDPSKLAPDRAIPQIVVDITLKALAKNASDRFQSADEFAYALKEAMVAAAERASSPAFVWGSEPIKNCASCGAAVPLGQKFCGDCGARIRVTSTQRNLAVGPKVQVTLPLPFTGRDEDLDWLDLCRFEVGSWVATARIIGDHGVGKSRLLRQFIKNAENSGDLVVEAGPDPWGAEVGYWALKRSVVGLAKLPADGGDPADWTSATAEARRGLEEIFGKTAAKADTPPHAWESQQGEMTTADRRFIAAEALRWAMARAARSAQKNRVVLAVEDLHAIDGASRNALLDVIQEPPLVGILLVGTHPPDFDPGWGGPERRLSGLPISTVATLAKGVGAAANGASEGNNRTVSPMYVDQLIRFTQEGGKSPPPRLGDLIAQRIERLNADARRVLQAIAVLGDDTPADLILTLVSVTDPDAAVDELRNAGMVEVTDGRVSSTHPLVRDVTLATIPAGVRRELHERAGSDELTRRDLPAEALAMHAYHAQNSFEALMLLETVANRCASRGDISGSVIALRRALDVARRELFRGDIDDPVRAVLIFSRKLGEALARSGDYGDANGMLLEALDLAGPTGADRVQVLGALAFAAKERARIEEAKRYLREALQLAKEELLVDLVDSLERARQSWALP